MGCARCGRSNSAGSRFCSGCSGALARRCTACAADLDHDARFCSRCGARADPTPAVPSVARKIVTLVFADLIGSITLHERLDAESTRRLMARYHRAMSSAVERHGGRVAQLLGDGVLAVFGIPRVAEDDALRAVHAAVAMQSDFHALASEPDADLRSTGLRVAVNTGEVVVGEGDEGVVGDPTNVAARLQHEASDGEVIIGESTRRLVADRVTLAPIGSLTLRGRAETVTAYRVVSLRPPAPLRATEFLGRDEELRRLLDLFEATRGVAGGGDAPGAARLGVVIGSPGVGKSRLIAEVARRVGSRATVLAARCDAAGGSTFAPIADALRTFFGIATGSREALRRALDAALSNEAERTRVVAGIDALVAGEPAAPQETFFVVRRLLTALAAARPVVLAIDDLHWAEPLLVDLVEHLAEWTVGTPLLVLVAGRPELRDVRSSLATGTTPADVVTLSGLDAAAATRLAANVIGTPTLPAALAGRVLSASEGNPLFVSELVRMLVQDGSLRREGDRWVSTSDLAGLEMPPTIHVLLAARIERLPARERDVLERAAVIGRHFSRAALAALLPQNASQLESAVEALRRAELVEPDTGWFLGEPALRFHHALIRDAAYRRVLKERRADLHERLAEWIVARVGDAVEHDETIGFHLEQAHRSLSDLGTVDEHARSLGEQAARRLGAAGSRALARDDVALAANLLGRAQLRLDPAHPARAALVVDWCEALLSSGEIVAASDAIAELERLAAGSPRLLARHTCFLGQLTASTDPRALRASAAALEAAAETLAGLGDAAGEAKAHAVEALVLTQLGRIGASEAALDEALTAARRAHDRRLANAVLAGVPVAALWGPSPVSRASGRCLDVVRVLRITQGAPAVEAVALRCQAVLEMLRGRGEAARRMIGAARAMVENLGITRRVLEADLFAGLIALLEEDAPGAELLLRRARDGIRALGLGVDAAQAGALLARALLAQGRLDEAEAASRESESLAGDSFKAAIGWRGVRAEVLVARGTIAPALELARDAVAIAAGTDDLLDHADARASLALALRASGRTAEADAEQLRAIELWETKGATLLADRARRSHASPQGVATPAREPCAALPARRVVRGEEGFATALRGAARLADAIASRDMAAIVALHAADCQVVDHTTGVTYDRAGLLATYEVLLDAREPVWRQDVLAVLGDELALFRLRSSAHGYVGTRFDVAIYERSELVLVEIEDGDRHRRSEVFAVDHLADAVARMYERHAELTPAGADRDAAAAIARSVATLMKPAAVERYAETLAEDVVVVDRRSMGLGPARGREPMARSYGSLQELSERFDARAEEILALRPDALLLRWTNVGTLRDGGGPYERPSLVLYTFGRDGLVTRCEQFDPNDEDAAIDRFERLVAAPGEPSFANAATRLNESLVRAWRTRDWDAITHLHSTRHHMDDRRRLMQVRVPAGPSMSQLRVLFDVARSRLDITPLATRGERLAMSRVAFTGESDEGGGRIEIGYLAVDEIDGDGRFGEVVLFDPDDLDAAHAELEARGTTGDQAQVARASSASARDR